MSLSSWLATLFGRSTSISGAKEALSYEDYMSPDALAMIRPRMNSVVADMQRHLRFSETRSVLLPFAKARSVLLATLNDWFGNYYDFFKDEFHPGLRFSPVIEGVKERLVITEFVDSEHEYLLTVFTEAKASVTWTSFAMRMSRLGKGKKSKFTYTQVNLKGYARDRASIDGQGEYGEARRNFKHNLRSFSSLYNDKLEKTKS